MRERESLVGSQRDSCSSARSFGLHRGRRLPEVPEPPDVVILDHTVVEGLVSPRPREVGRSSITSCGASRQRSNPSPTAQQLYGTHQNCNNRFEREGGSQDSGRTMSGGSLGQDCAARFREVSIARRDAEEDSRQTWISVLGDHCPSFPGASGDSVDPEARETAQIWRWKTSKTVGVCS